MIFIFLLVFILFINEECILGSRGRQLEGGKCDFILAVHTYVCLKVPHLFGYLFWHARIDE